MGIAEVMQCTALHCTVASIRTYIHYSHQEVGLSSARATYCSGYVSGDLLAISRCPRGGHLGRSEASVRKEAVCEPASQVQVLFESRWAVLQCFSVLTNT